MKKLAPPGRPTYFAKLEYLNPGGSVKDRAAIGLIARAEREANENAEARSSKPRRNTGIGLALIGVSRGYKVRCLSRRNFQKKRSSSWRALGAE